jgi:hypothetical protein
LIEPAELAPPNVQPAEALKRESSADPELVLLTDQEELAHLSLNGSEARETLFFVMPNTSGLNAAYKVCSYLLKHYI